MSRSSRFLILSLFSACLFIGLIVIVVKANPTVTCEFVWPQKVVVNGTKYTCSYQRPYCNNEKAQLGIGQCCANYGPYVDCVSIGPTTCAENWSCGNWSACTNSQQTRACTDANNCGTTTNKPKTSQSCTDSLYCKTVSPTQEAVVVKDASGIAEYSCGDIGRNTCVVGSKFGWCCPTRTLDRDECILVSPKRIILQGQTTADKKTLTVGETWSITPHLTLTAQSIDAKALPRQVWLVLSKDGIKLDDKIATQGQWYLYIEKALKGESDVNVFGVYIDSVFAGATSDMVQLRYAYINSMWWDMVGCAENWSCTYWTMCDHNEQTRTCTDTNSCGTTVNKPATSQPCPIISCKTISPTQEAVVEKYPSVTNEYPCNIAGYTACKSPSSKVGACCPTKTSSNQDCMVVVPKKIILQGQETSAKKTLTVGETWVVQGGLTLTAQSIDAKALPRQVWLVLSKDGIKLDDKIATQGQWYLYSAKSFWGQTDLNLFGIYIDSIFAGATSDMVQLRYAYINSVWWDELGSSSGCAENWSCGNWSVCTNGQQKRICADLNNCGTATNKPTEQQNCVCSENWSCADWSTCANSQQTRTCTDINNCGTIVNKPIEKQSCACAENWSCADWSTCANSQQTRTCTDKNNCGTNINKPLITQNCIVGQNCNEDWFCSEWTTCNNGQQTRACTDKNDCGTTANKPSLTKVCESSGASSSWSEQEKKLVIKIDKNLIQRLEGHILLQVEAHGEAWYVDPTSDNKYYLKDGNTAYEALRKFGLGIKNMDLVKIPVGFEDRFQDKDSDDDGLTDKLENGLGTDPNDSDSDSDGQLDGEEIKNNNNPLGPGKIKLNKKLANNLKGKILLQVESHGEAWYINPKDGKRYYMKDGNAAYQIMRFLSLGIKDNDLRKISVGDL